MIKDLISLANALDEKGLRAEADYLDGIIKQAGRRRLRHNIGGVKIYWDSEWEQWIVLPPVGLGSDYYADDKEDAIATAKAMKKELDSDSPDKIIAFISEHGFEAEEADKGGVKWKLPWRDPKTGKEGATIMRTETLFEAIEQLGY